MRIRTIKPEFFLHEGLFELEQETGLPIRISFAGLWCIADRDGRFKWEPRKIGVQILPYDSVDFSRVLHALTTRGFVLKYSSDSREFGCIPSFNRHQVINNRERPSDLPDPTECNICDASPTRDPRVTTRDQSCKEEGKGREGNMEGKGKDPLSVLTDESYPEIIETIWLIFPPTSRNRSSKKKITEAWAKTRPKPGNDALVQSLTAWAASHEWTKDGGQFAPGAHIWIKDRKWEAEPMAAPSRHKHAGIGANNFTGEEF